MLLAVLNCDIQISFCSQKRLGMMKYIRVAVLFVLYLFAAIAPADAQQAMCFRSRSDTYHSEKLWLVDDQECKAVCVTLLSVCVGKVKYACSEGEDWVRCKDDILSVCKGLYYDCKGKC